MLNVESAGRAFNIEHSTVPIQHSASMLDVTLHGVRARNLRDITLTFPKSTHTALIGPPAAGASTLLQVIGGEVRPEGGEVRIGARVVNGLKPAARPILAMTSAIDIP